MKKEKVFEMTPEQIEKYHPQISIRHSKNNIIRSVVLLKRADNTLTFANRSVEDIEVIAMTNDIWNAKRSIADVLRLLEKYLE